MKRPRFLFALLIGCIFAYSCKTSNLAQSSKIDLSKATINFQQKKDYLFNNGRVLFSNQFPAARLNKVTQQNDSTFNLFIEAENTPINPSPWYAFKVWSAEAKNIYFNLNYPTTTHRYEPKIITGNVNTKNIAAVQLSADKKQASFKLQLSSDTLLIAGQELIPSASVHRWEDSLLKVSSLKKQTIGFSILGKPIEALHTTESDGKKLIVVLSRQHPPEVTGFMAMQAFVSTVLGHTPLADNFRKQYELVVIPMINPDGVDEGNWRHNAAGVDLNRDWEFFVQPETRSVRDYLLKKIAAQKAKVFFGIDFHSTYNDIFYTNEDQPLNQTNIPGFTVKWLAEIKKSITGFNPNIKPSPNGGNVSKSWMGRVLNAEALTYEVGDNTPRVLLSEKGKIAAEKMMELLLMEGK